VDEGASVSSRGATYNVNNECVYVYLFALYVVSLAKAG